MIKKNQRPRKVTRKSARAAAKAAKKTSRSTNFKAATWKEGGREWSKVLGHFGSRLSA